MADLASDPALIPLADRAEPAWLWDFGAKLGPARLLWCNAAAEQLPAPGPRESTQAETAGGTLPRSGAARHDILTDWCGKTRLEAALSRIRLADGRAALLVLALEPAGAATAPQADAEPPQEQTKASPPERTETAPPAPPALERHHPLRFVWQMDADQHFTVDSAEFAQMCGPSTADRLGQSWPALAAALGLDPDGTVARLCATRETWSGVRLAWPVDGGAPLTVELSGLPVFDRDRAFRGYRGFGLCRDTQRLGEIAAQRAAEPAPPAADPTPADALGGESAHIFDAVARSTGRLDEVVTPLRPVQPPAPAATEAIPDIVAESGEPGPEGTTNIGEPEAAEISPLEGPLPGQGSPLVSEDPEGANHADQADDTLMPALSPGERNAFRELARQLNARLKPGVSPAEPAEPTPASAPPASATPARPPITAYEAPPRPVFGKAVRTPTATDEAAVLDRLPVGLLIHRGDQILFANAAFLKMTGYDNATQLAEAGGLDALFRDSDTPGTARAPIVGADGRSLTLESRLFSLQWGEESALALMLTKPAVNERSLAAEVAELTAALNTATDGVVMLDRHGLILSVNRAAESLFGQDQAQLVGERFIDIFVEESQSVARDYFESLASVGVTSLLNDGREVIGRVDRSGTIPLFMTMGRVSEDGERYCAVFRDISQWKKAEAELVGARRNAELASSAKSDFLAKISHEIRTPLNAIIGFSEVMMEERFGPIGNERYRGYVADIHLSGQHVVSLINDLLDLSKIEAGKLDLQFARVNLNDIVEQCVSLMQPQANRQRIIIRTSLSQALPPVVADARSVRQIVLNLLSNSVKFTDAGGQVIVSTALLDNGEAVIRVRDTGIGMSESDIAAAMEPFRQLSLPARWDKVGTGLGLPLTKALTEANRARFDIKSAAQNGTLVEITFPATRVLAE